MRSEVGRAGGADFFGVWLPPGQGWFSPKEVGALVGRSDQYVRDCFDDGRILGHVLKPRKGHAGRPSYQIPRDAVLMYLLETANYEPEDFRARVRELVKYLGG